MKDIRVLTPFTIDAPASLLLGCYLTDRSRSTPYSVGTPERDYLYWIDPLRGLIGHVGVDGRTDLIRGAGTGDDVLVSYRSSLSMVDAWRSPGSATVFVRFSSPIDPRSLQAGWLRAALEPHQVPLRQWRAESRPDVVAVEFDRSWSSNPDAPLAIQVASVLAPVGVDHLALLTQQPSFSIAVGERER